MSPSTTFDLESWSGASGCEVVICGLGSRTPLGLTAASSAAAARAGISRIGAHPCWIDKSEDPVNLACAAGIPHHVGLNSRIEQLFVDAVREVLGRVPKNMRPPDQCWIGLPEDRPGISAGLGASVSDLASRRFGFSPTCIRLLRLGHASGLIAMQKAAQQISAGQAESVLVVGVDSYCATDTLEWLDQNGRLMSFTNRNGFPPGEAAGACLLASRSVAQRYYLPALATVFATCTTREPHPIHSQEVCIGLGLSAALKGVISSVPAPKRIITATYCDINGERYRSEELVYALLRTQTAFVDANTYEAPADCWGDVGAASGPLFATLAIASSQRGYAKGQYPVLWAGSESGYRAAVLLKLDNPSSGAHHHG